MATAEATALQRAKDPVWYAQNVLGVDPWKGQQKILRAVAANKSVAVKSCHSGGKSTVAAMLATWFLPMHYRSRFISTAPTNRQVKTILWATIRQMVANAKVVIGPEPKTQHWELGPDWFGLGFTAPEHAPDKFQGQHAAGGLLAIVDEASGVSEKIFDEGVESILTGEAKLLTIGNPTNPSGYFARQFKDPNVVKIKVSAFDVPNFTQFGITQEDIEADTWRAKVTGPYPRPYLICPDEVADKWRKWGKDRHDMRYRARVLAEFPVVSADTLIGLDLIEAAQNREGHMNGPNELGVDVASFGGDSSAIAHRQGQRVRIVWRTPNTRVPEVAARVKYELQTRGATCAKIDTSGIGQGVYDILIGDDDTKRKVRSFTAAGKPDEPDRFAQRRDEAYWLVREAFVNGEIDIDPSDEELADEIAPIRWKILPNGKIKVQPKDELRKAGYGSPDSLDAVAYAWHSGDPRREFTFFVGG